MTRTWGDPIGRHYIPKGEPVAAPLQVRLWAARHRSNLRLAAALTSFVWLPALSWLAAGMPAVTR